MIVFLDRLRRGARVTCLVLLMQANFGRVDIAVLDFSKAFDTVPRNRLLTKLKHCGIAVNTLIWIRAFLTNRTQRVLVEGHGSRLVSVRSGVPQGTGLGPLLLLAFKNDLHIMFNIRFGCLPTIACCIVPFAM